MLACATVGFLLVLLAVGIIVIVKMIRSDELPGKKK